MDGLLSAVALAVIAAAMVASAADANRAAGRGAPRPDDRAGTRWSAVASPSPPHRQPADDGFRWVEAGLGGGAAVGALASGGALLLAVRRRRRRLVVRRPLSLVTNGRSI